MTRHRSNLFKFVGWYETAMLVDPSKVWKIFKIMSKIEPLYSSAENRYNGRIGYRRCSWSGVLLLKIVLGWWQNFGGVDKRMVTYPGNI